MSKTREKITVQVDGVLLADLRSLAEQERRPIEALVEEAIAALIEKRRQGTARPHVMSAYRKSRAPYAPLYKKLAE
ncbi:MAG: hypothetical protein OXI57_05765 [Rhodospirillales bacterium]|nr:hypothetical protein [Rhodospirillales bacterium]